MQKVDIFWVKYRQINDVYNLGFKYKHVSRRNLIELSDMLLKAETPWCYAFEYRSLTDDNLKLLEAFINISAMSSYSLDNS